MFEDGVSLGEKGRLEYLRAEQRGGMQVRLEDAARGARAGGSLPSPQPQLQPEADARRGQGPQHPSSTAPPLRDSCVFSTQIPLARALCY